MKRAFATRITREGDLNVAQALEIGVASQGVSADDALANLREALELHFEPPVATNPPMMRTLEIDIAAK